MHIFTTLALYSVLIEFRFAVCEWRLWTYSLQIFFSFSVVVAYFFVIVWVSLCLCSLFIYGFLMRKHKIVSPMLFQTLLLTECIPHSMCCLAFIFFSTHEKCLPISTCAMPTEKKYVCCFTEMSLFSCFTWNWDRINKIPDSYRWFGDHDSTLFNYMYMYHEIMQVAKSFRSLVIYLLRSFFSLLPSIFLWISSIEMVFILCFPFWWVKEWDNSLKQFITNTKIDTWKIQLNGADAAMIIMMLLLHDTHDNKDATKNRSTLTKCLLSTVWRGREKKRRMLRS